MRQPSSREELVVPGDFKVFRKIIGEDILVELLKQSRGERILVAIKVELVRTLPHLPVNDQTGPI